jgi:hypothetical protein
MGVDRVNNVLTASATDSAAGLAAGTAHSSSGGRAQNPTTSRTKLSRNYRGSATPPLAPFVTAIATLASGDLVSADSYGRMHMWRVPHPACLE